jgi:hypothetical protein
MRAPLNKFCYNASTEPLYYIAALECLRCVLQSQILNIPREGSIEGV